jgi:hypothetical protein
MRRCRIGVFLDNTRACLKLAEQEATRHKHVSRWDLNSIILHSSSERGKVALSYAKTNYQHMIQLDPIQNYYAALKISMLRRARAAFHKAATYCIVDLGPS